MRKTILSLAMTLAAFAAMALEPTRTKVFSEDEDGSRYYRIPGIAVCNDGTLVAVADKRGSSNGDLPNVISVVSKRSTDNGATWSEMTTIANGTSSSHTFGDPAIVYDPETETLLCVFSGDRGFWYGTTTAHCGFYMSKSTDHGKTWSDPVNFQSQIYKSNWRGAFCASGSMLRLTHGEHKGRIMFVANVNTNASNMVEYVREFVCYTDDLGETWHVANTIPPATDKGNESKLVELEDGTLMMSVRYPGTRLFTTSTDGGVTWSTPVKSSLVAQDCNGAIILYPSKDGKSRLLHSYPCNAKSRVNVSVSLSYDHGETWDFTRSLVEGYSAYSDLCVLHDGSIGLFVEDGTEHSDGANGGYELVFMRFDLNWLTNGTDSKVAEIECDDAEAEWFNINGRRENASTLPRGILIKKSPLGAQKIIN